MQPEGHDEKLRKLFYGLREADRRATPPFSQVWRSAMASRTRPRRMRRKRAFVTVGAGVAAAVVLVTLIYLGPFSRTPPAGTATLAQWQSPTAFLLNYPGQELFQEVPEIGRPVEFYGQNGST